MARARVSDVAAVPPLQVCLENRHHVRSLFADQLTGFKGFSLLDDFPCGRFSPPRAEKDAQ
jgi:hypothetical protein